MHPTTPTRRVILLGASNLVRSLPTVVNTIRSVWGEPIEIMAAMGHGRSYGQDSSVCGRKISGIFPCALWNELKNRPSLPTVALVTDIGNDLAYEVPVARVLEWVDGCLERLADVGAATIMTRLPIGNIQSIGQRRYRFFRTLLFPCCSIRLSEMKRRVEELDDALRTIAGQRKIPLIPVRNAWYGLDPIHIRRRAAREAWPAILSAWRDTEPIATIPRGSVWQTAYLRCLAPLEQSILGLRRRCDQPSGRLADGTTVSLY